MNQNTNMRLSEHFTLREFTISGTAIMHGIVNNPTEADIRRMRLLCEHVLEPLRRRFGVLRITSGFRCAALNKKVGGVKNSQHLRGEAADLHIGDPEVARKMIAFLQEEGIEFDQCLLEYNRFRSTRWVHISYVKGHNRRQAITQRGFYTEE
ncbi:MAG: peptidase M15 [Prevotella sp.]|nr:peptidase M15 [Prevotella sp.]